MSIDKDKYKELLIKIAGGDDIIPLIHNYCDRWCERCTRSSKCSVFRVEQEMHYSDEEMDIKNEKFWENLSTIYSITFEMLHEKMIEFGINPDEIEVDDDDLLLKEPEETELLKMANAYAHDVHKWMEKNYSVLVKNVELHQNINETNAISIADSIDIIQHYFLMVASKTYRASLDYDVDEDKYDSLGSAKLAIIIVKRSIASWSTLLHYFPSFEDDILSFLKTLSVIKKLLMKTFPTAMEFKRPGFDE